MKIFSLFSSNRREPENPREQRRNSGRGSWLKLISSRFSSSNVVDDLSDTEESETYEVPKATPKQIFQCIKSHTPKGIRRSKSISRRSHASPRSPRSGETTPRRNKNYHVPEGMNPLFSTVRAWDDDTQQKTNVLFDDNVRKDMSVRMMFAGIFEQADGRKQAELQNYVSESFDLELAEDFSDAWNQQSDGSYSDSDSAEEIELGCDAPKQTRLESLTNISLLSSPVMSQSDPVSPLMTPPRKQMVGADKKRGPQQSRAAEIINKQQAEQESDNKPARIRRQKRSPSKTALDRNKLDIIQNRHPEVLHEKKTHVVKINMKGGEDFFRVDGGNREPLVPTPSSSSTSFDLEHQILSAGKRGSDQDSESETLTDDMRQGKQVVLQNARVNHSGEIQSKQQEFNPRILEQTSV